MRGLVLLSVLWLVWPLAAGEIVESRHYRLYWDGPKQEAREALEVLDKAYLQLEKFFGRAPKLAPWERLEVRFFETRKRWASVLRSHGISVPPGGGYYWTRSKSVYLYRQPTIYYTRVLLIHEAAHQFHFLARTNNRCPPFAWYVEGLAEHLGRHTWDGETLRLGVIPTLSLSDYSAAALKLLENEKINLAREISSRSTPRPLGWALVGYLVSQHPVAFARLRAELDRGVSPGLPFRQHLGDPAKLRKTLVAWLRQNQETWAPVFNQWEGIGPGRLQGVARVVSICRVKARVTRLATTLEVPVRGWGGLALHWVDARDYTAALINRQGVLRIDRRKGGRWQQLYIGQGPKPINGRLSLVATRTKEGVYLTVGQGRHGPFELPGSHFGLALDRARVRFRKTSWK